MQLPQAVEKFVAYLVIIKSGIAGKGGEETQGGGGGGGSRGITCTGVSPHKPHAPSGGQLAAAESFPVGSTASISVTDCG